MWFPNQYQLSRSVVSNSVTPWTTALQASHQFLELAQTHIHQVSDAIQLSHPLSSPSPPAFNLSQHWCLFKWVSSSLQVAKILEFQFQHQSFQWIFRTDFLYDGLVGSPCSPRDSQESSTPQFKSINSLALSFLYSSTLTWMSFPGGSDGKASACNVGDPGSIPGWGRSPGEGNGNPL